MIPKKVSLIPCMLLSVSILTSAMRQAQLGGWGLESEVEEPNRCFFRLMEVEGIRPGKPSLRCTTQ